LFVKISTIPNFNLDALTYAGNLENIVDIEKEPNYTFIKGDIVDAPFIDALFAEHQFDGVCIWRSRMWIVPLPILYLLENKCYWDNEFVKCRKTLERIMKENVLSHQYR
jgi:hypothetical protein